MKQKVISFILFLTVIIALVGCNSNFSNDSSNGNSNITIASKNFTEQDILGELLAQRIEAETGLTVDRRPQLGGSFVCHQALLAGKIDSYIEYTGTAYNAILQKEVISDAREVYQSLKKVYSEDFQLEVMEPLGFENTFAVIIRKEDAENYKISTISDLASYTSKWRSGFGYEFMERQDGFSGLSKTYGLDFQEAPQIMDLGLLYRALVQKQVDVIVTNSTDGQIARLDLVVLQDDKNYFPPYEAAPIFRKETLNKYPQLQEVVSQMAGKISADEIRQLNYLVEGEFRKVRDVVSEFRQTKGL
ncbi:Substrate-binding region of ABC-type glycine betaine transport system [Richelia intracellularis HH01]|uniref:Substrate-binding region of ABC-type glycine betaine transport system n=1 Tax=Richelia intracellularis HH01 TaxID=1165094 RepID=M1X0S0_9NOST|nr:glycine betaine ABC transporter substrate-binding protein [Richelia intracellularis]CCH67648.1 Substrate-binding region of ABC-type glycine betaine transport system [Richelia intracellularis HH01]HAE05354.1 ABC transporter substrate-binding protein [Richelia sp.]